MIVLAIDTALQACSAVIAADGVCLARKTVPLEKGHAERLAPMVAAVFQEADIGASDLDRIGVVSGPGGFTGLRVGLAFARALALGIKADVVGVNSLFALAKMVNGDGLRAALIDARRGQVYGGVYDVSGAEILPHFVSDPKEALKKMQDAVGATPVALTGSGVGLLPGTLQNGSVVGGDHQIDPLILAALAAEAPTPEGPPAPLYLRGPDAKASSPSLFAGLSPV